VQVVLLTLLCVFLCCVGDGDDLGGSSWWKLEGGVVRFCSGD
jgi:hypothetical protein